MESDQKEHLRPGARVKVTQQIAARNYTYTTDVTGTIVEFQQKPTGSWFAHSKNDRLWLDRLVIRKDDGELTTLNLDDYTVVNVQQAPSGADQAASAGEKNESDLPV
jgi:hypothetical protein